VGTVRVICIEDDAELGDNLAELLAAEGFAPTVVATGREGIARALADPPDVILCDFLLPDMDGRSVIDAVRAHHRTLAVPFVFVTARAERSALRDAIDLGAAAYLTKPFACADLVRTVRACAQRPPGARGL
jgi:DNA-binding response OmpR family regulator